MTNRTLLLLCATLGVSLFHAACSDDPSKASGPGSGHRDAGSTADQSSRDATFADGTLDNPDAPPRVSCDPLTQSPCAADEACVLEMSQPVCEPAGTLTLGQTCGAHGMVGGGCIRGLICAFPPAGGDSQCLPVCDPSGSPAECPPGYECAGVLAGLAPAQLCVAATTCSVFDATSCGDGQKCDLAAPPKTECFPAGTLDVGAACDNATTTCKAGLLCTSVQGAASQCYDVCNPTGAPCATGTCLELTAYPGVGVCH